MSMYARIKKVLFFHLYYPSSFECGWVFFLLSLHNNVHIVFIVSSPIYFFQVMIFIFSSLYPFRNKIILSLLFWLKYIIISYTYTSMQNWNTYVSLKHKFASVENLYLICQGKHRKNKYPLNEKLFHFQCIHI